MIASYEEKIKGSENRHKVFGSPDDLWHLFLLTNNKSTLIQKHAEWHNQILILHKGV